MIQEQVFIHIGISVALVSQIERGDISTPDIQNRYLSALAATLKLRCDLQLKIA
jgi:transcriptional regulator with XRE-family HTH domain